VCRRSLVGPCLARLIFCPRFDGGSRIF
jgi:hypothetical protein